MWQESCLIGSLGRNWTFWYCVRWTRIRTRMLAPRRAILGFGPSEPNSALMARPNIGSWTLATTLRGSWAELLQVNEWSRFRTYWKHFSVKGQVGAYVGSITTEIVHSACGHTKYIPTSKHVLDRHLGPCHWWRVTNLLRRWSLTSYDVAKNHDPIDKQQMSNGSLYSLPKWLGYSEIIEFRLI